MSKNRKRNNRKRNKPVNLDITSNDISVLKEYCLASVSGFSGLGVDDGKNIFIKCQDNGDANVLAIAHLDVSKGVNDITFKYDKDTHTVQSRALDDRLGVWALCQKLPTVIGARSYDILLTTGEESGNSTAELFSQHTEKYNWIFQMDRMGCDAVHYGFTNKAWLQELESDGWDLGYGSFSDISQLEHGTVSAVNFGVGYNGQHSDTCDASLRQVATQIYRVASFYKQHSNTKFTHVYNGSKYGRYWDYTDPYEWQSDPYVGQIKAVSEAPLCIDCAKPIANSTYNLSGFCEDCTMDYEAGEYDLATDYSRRRDVMK